MIRLATIAIAGRSATDLTAELFGQMRLGRTPELLGASVDRLVEFFDCLALSSPPYFRGGVTPAGSGTCATFSVIDTGL